MTTKLHAAAAGWVLALVVMCLTGCKEATPGVVEAPTPSPDAGEYDGSLQVSLASATAGAGIRYTTDGSAPSSTYGKEYDGTPFGLSASATVRAVAYREGWADSPITDAVYTITSTAETVEPPALDPLGGSFMSSPVELTMTTATGGALIHYTIDGSTPTASYGTLYEGVPVSLASTATVKAVASKEGYTTSEVVTQEYEIAGTVATPTLDPGGGTFTATQYVTLSTSTEGARIRYTLDGSEPTDVYGTLYAGTPVTIAASRTLKAIAYVENVSSSMLASADYTIEVATSAPYFTPAAGTYPEAQTVAIASVTEGASIRFTTDGSMPTSSTGTLYTDDVEVTRNTTLRAIAYAGGMRDSTVSSAAYVIAGTVTTPVCLPVAGTYAAAQTVTISTTTDGATVVYTTDGTVPSRTNGTAYTAPITVDATRTVRAFAYKTGWTDSATATAAYSIAVDATGTVGLWTSVAASGDDAYVAYYDSTNADLKLAATADAGANWSIAKADYPGSVGQYGSLATDGTALYVAYYDGTSYDLRFARSDDGGGSWTRTLVDATDRGGQYDSIAVSGSSVYISYYQYVNTTTGYLRLATSADGGETWSCQTLDSTAGTTGMWSSLAADAANLYVSYYSSAGGGVLRFLRYFGGAWSTAEDWDTGSVGQYGSLRLGSPGATLYVVYYDATNADLLFGVSTSVDGGDNWSTPSPVAIDSDGYVGQWACLAVAGGLELTVSYYEDYNYNLRVIRSLDGGLTWGAPVVVDTGGVGQYTAVADTGSRIYVSYYDLVNLDLKVATSSDGGMSWVRY